MRDKRSFNWDMGVSENGGGGGGGYLLEVLNIRESSYSGAYIRPPYKYHEPPSLGFRV